MVRPAGATALAPPTKYILKLKLKKKKQGKHFWGIPTKNKMMNFYQSDGIPAAKRHLSSTQFNFQPPQMTNLPPRFHALPRQG